MESRKGFDDLKINLQKIAAYNDNHIIGTKCYTGDLYNLYRYWSEQCFNKQLWASRREAHNCF